MRRKVGKKVNRLLRRIGVLAILVAAMYAVTMAQNSSSSFHNAPASVKATKNPVEGKPQSAAIGGQVYATNCAACHGPQGQGTGNVPALKTGPAQSATQGQLFWFITKGDEQNGMPSWASLSAARRWEVVAYLKSGLPPIPKPENSRDLDAVAAKAPAPKGDFTDFRYETPGKIRKINVQELPAPFATQSAACT